MAQQPGPLSSGRPSGLALNSRSETQRGRTRKPRGRRGGLPQGHDYPKDRNTYHNCSSGDSRLRTWQLRTLHFRHRPAAGRPSPRSFRSATHSTHTKVPLLLEPRPRPPAVQPLLLANSRALVAVATLIQGFYNLKQSLAGFLFRLKFFWFLRCIHEMTSDYSFTLLFCGFWVLLAYHDHRKG